MKFKLNQGKSITLSGKEIPVSTTDGWTEIPDDLLISTLSDAVVQPDWHQNRSKEKDYIKNKPMSYSFAELSTTEDVELKNKAPGSITLLRDLSNWKERTFETFKSEEFKRFPYADIGALVPAVRGILEGAQLDVASPVFTDYQRISQLDSINYSYDFGNMGTIYTILDTSILTENQKKQFPIAGLYIKRSSRQEVWNYVGSFVCRAGVLSIGRMRAIYLPQNTQGKEITDSNGYFSEKTVEGALDQLGGYLHSNSLILNSSTADSSKKFKITVDDTGTLSTTEITESETE